MKLDIINPTKFDDDVLATLTDTYSMDAGVTTFQGQSISALVSGLRDRGWKRLGGPVDIEDTLIHRGFTVTKARRISHLTGRVTGRVHTVVTL